MCYRPRLAELAPVVTEGIGVAESSLRQNLNCVVTGWRAEYFVESRPLSLVVVVVEYSLHRLQAVLLRACY